MADVPEDILTAEEICIAAQDAIRANWGAEIIYIHDAEGEMVAAVVPRMVKAGDNVLAPNETWRIMHAVEQRAMEAGLIPHGHIEPGMF